MSVSSMHHGPMAIFDPVFAPKIEDGGCFVLRSRNLVGNQAEDHSQRPGQWFVTGLLLICQRFVIYDLDAPLLSWLGLYTAFILRTRMIQSSERRLRMNNLHVPYLCSKVDNVENHDYSLYNPEEFPIALIIQNRF